MNILVRPAIGDHDHVGPSLATLKTPTDKFRDVVRPVLFYVDAGSRIGAKRYQYFVGGVGRLSLRWQTKQAKLRGADKN